MLPNGAQYCMFNFFFHLVDSETSAHHYPYGDADADYDNADAKSDEPEWANCGPIS